MPAPTLQLVSAVAALVALILALDRLFLWFERRGWMYWRRTTRHGGGGGLGNAMLEVHAILEPDKRHVVEERRREQVEERESGDPPAR